MHLNLEGGHSPCSTENILEDMYIAIHSLNSQGGKINYSVGLREGGFNVKTPCIRYVRNG